MIIGISGKIKNGKDLVGDVIQYLSHNGINALDNREDDEIITLLDNRDYHSKWKIKKYADKLKDIICILIGCSREDLENQEFKASTLSKEWDVTELHLDFGDYCDMFLFPSLKDANEHLEKNYRDVVIFGDRRTYYLSKSIETKSLTVRDLLQMIGTNLFRNMLHPNTWINALFSEYKNDSKWLVTDVRFLNEKIPIDDRGFNIRVNRDIKNRFPKLWEEFGSNNDDEFYNWLKEKDFDLYKKLTHDSETALDDIDFKYVINNNSSIKNIVEEVKNIMIKENIL